MSRGKAIRRGYELVAGKRASRQTRVYKLVVGKRASRQCRGRFIVLIADLSAPSPSSQILPMSEEIRPTGGFSGADKSAAPLPGADKGRHGEPAPTLSDGWLIANHQFTDPEIRYRFPMLLSTC